MKNWIIRTFGLKGSWKWAKKQMMSGKMVRCRHFTGALKFRIDNPENTLLQFNYTRLNKHLNNSNPLWETSNHHLSYEDFVDYEVFEWWHYTQRIMV